MRFVRKLVLPALIATPLWLLAPVPFFRWDSLVFELGVREFAWGFVLTAFGLLAIGLPAASFLCRRAFPTIIKVGILLIIGAAGGAVVAMIYVFAGGVFQGDKLDADFVKHLPAIAKFGVLPGAIVALVGTVLNLSMLRNAAPLRDA